MGNGYDQPADVPTKFFQNYEETIPILTGKTAAITGCTTGLGFIAATTLAKKGANVIMLNRPSARAEAAHAKVKASAAAGSKVSSVDCDLSDFASVRDAVKKLPALAPDGLDVLVNNAGIMAMPDTAGKDGYDIQMTTNHHSHFLLTKELFPLLTKAGEKRGEARVVNVSSEARKGRPLDRKYLAKSQGNLGGDGAGFLGLGHTLLFSAKWQRYHQTKLANAVFTSAMDDKLRAKGSKVKALVCHPGVAATNLQVTTNQAGGLPAWMCRFLFKFGISAEDGTIGLLRCATDPNAQSGEFYGPKGIAGDTFKLPLEDYCKDQKSKDLLWEESCKATGNFDI